MDEHATPLPPKAKLCVTTMTWARGRMFHRIHPEIYGVSEFNGSGLGNGRFNPIVDADGRCVPTLYGGGTFACALMEVPFHDVPFAVGVKTVDKGRLESLLHSVVEPMEDLCLADLTAMPLRKLGISRRALIDAEKEQYRFTRAWAEAIYAQCPEVQGLCWTSRQDDTQLALVLFGSRISDDALNQSSVSWNLVEDPFTYNAVLDVADIIGVRIVSII